MRLMACLETEASLELVGTLSPVDVTGQLELSTGADWHGDACTSRSVSGMHLELTRSLAVPSCVEIFQTATSCSTAENEVVALSHGLRHFGLPVQDLVH